MLHRVGTAAAWGLIPPPGPTYTWLPAEILEEKFGSQFDAFLGTPWFTHVMRWIGCDIGRGSIILGHLPSELQLLHSGRDLVVEQGAVVSTHYVRSGRYYYKTVR